VLRQLQVSFEDSPAGQISFEIAGGTHIYIGHCSAAEVERPEIGHGLISILMSCPEAVVVPVYIDAEALAVLFDGNNFEIFLFGSNFNRKVISFNHPQFHPAANIHFGKVLIIKIPGYIPGKRRNRKKEGEKNYK
jgi:hypothetical protein